MPEVEKWARYCFPTLSTHVTPTLGIQVSGETRSFRCNIRQSTAATVLTSSSLSCTSSYRKSGPLSLTTNMPSHAHPWANEAHHGNTQGLGTRPDLHPNSMWWECSGARGGCSPTMAQDPRERPLCSLLTAKGPADSSLLPHSMWFWWAPSGKDI